MFDPLLLNGGMTIATTGIFARKFGDAPVLPALPDAVSGTMFDSASRG
ncbi:MAG: hypothetical protein U5J82_04350 [Desulfobacterales bacterium]|nr:hypothetical protein [Desulfobacterales bacterium]